MFTAKNHIWGQFSAKCDSPELILDVDGKHFPNINLKQLFDISHADHCMFLYAIFQSTYNDL